MTPIKPTGKPVLFHHGLTLIELLLGIAIIGVLTAIAIPLYQDYQERIRIHQAITDLSALQAMIDSHFLDFSEYPDSLSEVGMNSMRDPWGHPYHYLPFITALNRSQARKDHALVPINSDYDLYSSGPDGISQPPLTAQQSRDDIVRANDGKYMGPAADY